MSVNFIEFSKVYNTYYNLLKVNEAIRNVFYVTIHEYIYTCAQHNYLYNNCANKEIF